MSKKNAQRGHFRRRVYERYNALINDSECDYLVSRIKNNDKTVAKFLMKQSNRVTILLLCYKGLEIVAAYDKIRKSLITALPQSCKEVENIMTYIQEVEEV